MHLTSIDLVSPVAEWLLALLYVLLACFVTADVLLKKSDVRGALGWIGVAWMSPIVGSLLYYMFGINRVTRRSLRSIRLDRSPSRPFDPDGQLNAPPNIMMLSKIGEKITGAQLTANNEISILQGGDAGYSAMLAAISKAQDCIALTSYIFRNDSAGQAFSDALIAAAGRGVEVRVLLDSVGIGYIFPRILFRLKAGGVRVARFLHTWVPWRMPFLNMRNHRKLLVVDGNTAFMGGMNIGAENSRRLTPGAYIEDIHFKIEGAAVRAVMDAFARDWAFTTDEVLDDECWWPNLEPSGSIFARGLRSGPDGDIYRLENILGAALTLARSRVRIVTPYFLPDQRLEFAIAQARLRGVDVDILIPEHCDYSFLDWAMRAHLRFFKGMPAKVYTTPLPFDHSKIVTVDGEWCLIGSSNWDTRSLRLNFEFDMECYGSQLIKQLDDIIDAKTAGARILSYQDLAKRSVAIKLRDAAARLLTPYL